MDINEDHPNSFAPQACVTCRKQKRKCDKQRPTCSLCIRLGRQCDYTEDIKPPTSEDFNTLRAEVAELKLILQQGSNGNGHGRIGMLSQSDGFAKGPNIPTPDQTNGSGPDILPLSTSSVGIEPPPWTRSSYFPSAFFLDSNVFAYSRSTVQPVHIQVPPSALSSLGNSTELRQMIEKYFLSVHSYFPIISKSRLYQHLADPDHEPGADVALLFMAMKLANTEVPDGEVPQTQLYQDVKSLFSYVEARNVFSVQMIQALLLTGLYEIGHAIHPTSYLTTGHAARLGHAMGIHERGAPQMLPSATSWTEQEERRRVWWAVILLDRFVNLGNRTKPLASADPSLESHLPTEDQPWDRGQMIVAAPLILSASPTVQAAPFARSCQAAYLLGKVVRHLNDKNIPLEYRFDEALQLNRTIRALASLLSEEVIENEPFSYHALCTSMAICYSALFDLYDGYSCTERTLSDAPDTQLVMQKESIKGTFEISDAVMIFARRIKRLIETAGLSRVSPFVIDALYQAAANFAWDFNECSDASSAQYFAELKELLLVLSKRWRVAQAYISILDGFWMQTRFGDQSGMRNGR